MSFIFKNRTRPEGRSQHNHVVVTNPRSKAECRRNAFFVAAGYALAGIGVAAYLACKGPTPLERDLKPIPCFEPFCQQEMCVAPERAWPVDKFLPNSIYLPDRIHEAHALLENDRKYPTNPVITPGGSIKTANFWLAAFNKDTKQITTIKLVKDENGETVSSSHSGFEVRRMYGNGLNAVYDVEKPPEYVVLALKKPVALKTSVVNGRTNYEARTVVYTPAQPELGKNEELVKHGYVYLANLVNGVLEEFRESGNPFLKKVSETLPPEVMMVMILNEHVEVGVFQKTGDVASEALKVLAMLGANMEESYNYGVSPVGARGIGQLMPSTYDSIYRLFGGKAKLDPDFYSGSLDHKNAVKFQTFHHYGDMAILSRDGVLRSSDYYETVAFLAACYNAGLPTVKSAFNKYGAMWAYPGDEIVSRRNAIDQEIRDLTKKLRRGEIRKRDSIKRAQERIKYLKAVFQRDYASVLPDEGIAYVQKAVALVKFMDGMQQDPIFSELFPGYSKRECVWSSSQKPL